MLSTVLVVQGWDTAEVEQRRDETYCETSERNQNSMTPYRNTTKYIMQNYSVSIARTLIMN